MIILKYFYVKMQCLTCMCYIVYVTSDYLNVRYTMIKEMKRKGIGETRYQDMVKFDS